MTSSRVGGAGGASGGEISGGAGGAGGADPIGGLGAFASNGGGVSGAGGVLGSSIQLALALVGILDELSLAAIGIQLEVANPQTVPALISSISGTEFQSPGETIGNPFPTSGPPVILPPVSGSGIIVSGPSVSILPVIPTTPVVTPPLPNVSQPAASPTPERTSGLIWLIGAAAAVGVRRRSR